MIHTEQQKENRLETVRQQFWPEDIAQLQELESQWQQEPLSYLLCLAMHIGVQVLSTSRGPRVATGRYGLYTSQELTAELGPRLAAAALFLERNGYSIIPVPATLAPLVERFTQRKNGSGQVTPLDLYDHFKDHAHKQEFVKSSESDDRWRFWKKDMQQLKVLQAQWADVDRLVYLRCISLHIGVLVLSTTNAPDRVHWRYGNYTAVQLAEALSPCLAPAVQFLERNGYSLIPVPTTVTVLIELLARSGSSLSGQTTIQDAREKRVSHPQTVGDANANKQEQREEETAASSANSPRSVMNQTRRKERGIGKDGDI